MAHHLKKMENVQLKKMLCNTSMPSPSCPPGVFLNGKRLLIPSVHDVLIAGSGDGYMTTFLYNFKKYKRKLVVQ
jgi:hypothetical protein